MTNGWEVILGNLLLIVVIFYVLVASFKVRLGEKVRKHLSLIVILLFLGLILPIRNKIVELDILGFRAKIDNAVRKAEELEESLKRAFEEYGLILGLYEESVSNGGQESSYRELIKKSQSEIFANIVNLKADDVKTQIAIQMNTLKGFNLEHPDNKRILVNEELHTGTLLGFLVHTDPKYTSIRWVIRGKAAQLLADREEWPVPDKLIESLKTKNKLVVKASALESFEKLMSDFGYIRKDIFDFEDAIDWWEEEDNRARVKSKLQK